MKEYANLFLLIGALLVLMTIVIPVQYMYYAFIVVIVYELVIYLLCDNSDVVFLSKLKYVLLISIVLYFFILRNRSWGDLRVDEFTIGMSDLLIFIQTMFLFYILIRGDRFHQINRLSNIEE
jgi:hypothetical protein